MLPDSVELGYRRNVDRTLSIFEMFILAAIQRGIATPYDLQRQASISVGASLPVLGRLKQEQLLERREETGKHGRREYALTKAGVKKLAAGLKALGKTVENLPAVEVETALRAAALAGMNGNLALFRVILEQASAQLVKEAWKRDNNSLTFDPTDLATSYRTMLAHCSAAGLRAEANALSQLKEQVAQSADTVIPRKPVP
jgi:DNA-binding PadR family transcriptional regulator